MVLGGGYWICEAWDIVGKVVMVMCGASCDGWVGVYLDSGERMDEALGVSG